MKTDADIMAETREWIEKVGWTPCTMEDPETKKVCSLGGLVISQGWLVRMPLLSTIEINRAYKPEVQRIVIKVLRALGINLTDAAIDELDFNQILFAMTMWNDRPERTEEEVLDAWAKAEKIERAGYDPDA